MAPRNYVYVGCYTHESPIGIRVYDASDPSGRLVEQSVVEGIEHPSFLTAHPGGRVLYAVSETAPSGGLIALRINPVDGSLVMIDQASSHGSAPCYISVDARGRHLYVANYLSGNIAVQALADDGRFGEVIATRQHRGSGPSVRQEGPHAHCVLPGPNGDSVYAVDLGTDHLSHYVHHHGAEGFMLVDELALDAGTGPRHLAFHPEQPIGFVVGELDSTIISLEVDPVDGRLTRLDAMTTLPIEFAGESIAAEVRVHPNGRSIYVSNRGHDSIAIFGFAGMGQPLEPRGHVPSGGATPRNFAVHPSGRALLVANQDSHSIVLFEIDPSTAIPRQLDVSYAVSEPTCLTFVQVSA